MRTRLGRKGQTVKKVKKKTAGKNIMEQRVKHALAACRKGDRDEYSTINISPV